jgi:hypothetical protein
LSDNDHGEVVCTVLASNASYATNNNLKPTATQVYLGLDANNASGVSSKRVNASSTDTAGTVTKATSLTVDGLTKGTAYSAFCTATNGVPVFPGFVSYTSLDNFTPINFTTAGELPSDDDDDFALLASSNVVSLFLMIAALIFN